MSALLLIYSLILIAIIAFVSGIFIIGGLGWALIAFSISLITLVLFLSRGLINGE